MPYDLTKRCLTEGCGGTPFFGLTASPGYCDSCHVARTEAEIAVAEDDGGDD